MNGPADRPPLNLVILLIIGAVSLGLFAVGVAGHTGWTLIVVGLLLVVASIRGLWRIQKARYRTLRSQHLAVGCDDLPLGRSLVLHSSGGEHLATPGVTPELPGEQAVAGSVGRPPPAVALVASCESLAMRSVRPAPV